MHSFLIVGGNQKEREKKAKELAKDIHPIDTLILRPDPSIKIEKIRELKHSLSLKPIKSKKKVGFIFQAEKMTIYAQNALLKTLEEPPETAMLILTTSNLESLLPTIVSRCQIVNLGVVSSVKITKEDWESFVQLLKKNEGERLEYSPKIALKREEALEWLKRQMGIWRYLLLFQQNYSERLPQQFSSPEKISNSLSTKEVQKTIEIVEETYQMLLANVNVRLALDNLLLSYPKI